MIERHEGMPISYSRYGTHLKCGFKYDLTYIQKIKTTPQPPSPAMERGSLLHNSAEDYVLGKIPELHPELKPYGQWLHSLRENYDCKPELKWGITLDWQFTEFDDDQAMARGIWDLLIKTPEPELSIKEYKTGKVYQEHSEQRELYAMAGLVMFPEYDSAECETVYFDKVTSEATTVTREQLPALKEKWEQRFHMMGLKESWIPNPNWTCRYCEHARDQGGICRFG